MRRRTTKLLLLVLAVLVPALSSGQVGAAAEEARPAVPTPVEPALDESLGQAAVAAVAGVQPAGVRFAPGSAVTEIAGRQWGYAVSGGKRGGSAAGGIDQAPEGGAVVLVVDLATNAGTKVVLDRAGSVVGRRELGIGTSERVSFEAKETTGKAAGATRSTKQVFPGGQCTISAWTPQVAWFGSGAAIAGNTGVICSIPVAIFLGADIWQCCFLKVHTGTVVWGTAVADAVGVTDCEGAPYFSPYYTAAPYVLNYVGDIRTNTTVSELQNLPCDHTP